MHQIIPKQLHNRFDAFYLVHTREIEKLRNCADICVSETRSNNEFHLQHLAISDAASRADHDNELGRATHTDQSQVTTQNVWIKTAIMDGKSHRSTAEEGK